MSEPAAAFWEKIKGRIPSTSGLPYHLGEKPFSEPTVLGILGLLAQDLEKDYALQLGKWVRNFQNPDGSIGHNPETPTEGLWVTSPYVIAAHHLGMDESKTRAIQFLLSFKSEVFEKNAANELDTMITGWPWVKGAFGWVGPTAWAVLALQLAGQGNHDRVVEGRKFLKDRCIPDQGWNTGNKKVFNSQLFPFFDTTALAALALGKSEKEFLGPILGTLKKNLETCESLYSCSWGCICLENFGEDVAFLRKKISDLLDTAPIDQIDLCHASMGLIALSSKKIFTA